MRSNKMEMKRCEMNSGMKAVQNVPSQICSKPSLVGGGGGSGGEGGVGDQIINVAQNVQNR